MSVHRARVVWEGGRDDLRAHAVHLADQVVSASCAAERGGDPSRADPEEMFVGALSACHMLWFLDYARRERRRVATYVDRAEGEMDGTRFTRVVLRPRVEWVGDVPEHGDLQRLHEAAHQACFIASSVSCAVEVEPA
jgi:organic hydroperoxide reductase OsmC/OhrA